MLEIIRKAYHESSRRIMFLDYDGTLVPFSRIPAEAKIDINSREIISKIAEIPKNRIVVISGRNREFLEDQFKDIAVDLVAEHGFLVKKFGSDWHTLNNHDMIWKKEVDALFSEINKLIPGTFTEEKESSMALHYRAIAIDPFFLAKMKFLVGEFTFQHPYLDVLLGNRVIECKAGGFSKGTAALSVLENSDPDFILAIGDDVTDETLFKELKGRAFTVKVGFGKTYADFRLPFQKDVIPFLESLYNQDLKKFF